MRLDDYLQNWHSIPGWVSKGAIRITQAIDRVQKTHNIYGNVGEIGVYNGKFLTLLALLRREKELTLGIDLFPLDFEQKTWQTLEKYKVVPQTHLEKIDSQKYSAKKWEKLIEDSIELHPKFRLFHVDGDHKYKPTLYDMGIAKDLLDENGVMIIDDFFHSGFPEETWATIDFIRRKGNTFFPIAMGANKIWLANGNEFILDYQDAIREELKNEWVVSEDFFGQSVLGCHFGEWKEQG